MLKTHTAWAWTRLRLRWRGEDEDEEDIEGLEIEGGISSEVCKYDCVVIDDDGDVSEL